jgi:hypothetical protein
VAPNNYIMLNDTSSETVHQATRYYQWTLHKS